MNNLFIGEEPIQKLKDQDLLSSLENLFASERKTSRLILLHLLEVDARELYLKRGYESIFQLLVQKYKLSETAANRRIKAMRLLKDVPDAQVGLVTGELNLTTLSMAQAQIKQEEKITGHKISTELKTQIVERIKNKTQAETEAELFKALPHTASQPRNHQKRISETETRLGLNVPDRVLNKLNRLREIWSHIDPHMDFVEIIERCADETLKRVDPKTKTEKKLAKSITEGCEITISPRSETILKAEVKADTQPVTLRKGHPQSSKKIMKHSATAAEVIVKYGTETANTKPWIKKPKAKRATYFPAHVERAIHHRAESCCEFVDALTGRRCRSRFMLQIDHIISVWAGGSNELSNLQLLCAKHNRHKYKIETKQLSLSDQLKPYRIVS